jgi:hypothetical protein
LLHSSEAGLLVEHNSTVKPHQRPFAPGNLILSRSVYVGTAATVAVGQPLPPVCGAQATCGTATNNGTYPGVWNNDLADGSFGVTSPIYLDQITTGGTLVKTLAVPTTAIVTSFSSKSELALNLSTDGNYITFMGYDALVNALDVSNSNTPGVIDPTNPVGSAYYRLVAKWTRTVTSLPLRRTHIAATTAVLPSRQMAFTIRWEMRAMEALRNRRELWQERAHS